MEPVRLNIEWIRYYTTKRKTDALLSLQTLVGHEKVGRGAPMGYGGQIQQPSANLLQAVFRQWFIWTSHLFPNRDCIRMILLARSSTYSRDETVPHLACEPLKRKLAALGTRAPRELSIV